MKDHVDDFIETAEDNLINRIIGGISNIGFLWALATTLLYIGNLITYKEAIPNIIVSMIVWFSFGILLLMRDEMLAGMFKEKAVDAQLNSYEDEN